MTAPLAVALTLVVLFCSAYLVAQFFAWRARGDLGSMSDDWSPVVTADDMRRLLGLGRRPR